MCESCTKIAEPLKTVIPTPPPADPSRELSDMKTTITEKQLEVDTLAETNRILQAKIKEMTGSMARLDKNYTKEKEAHKILQSEAKILKTGIASYEERIATLQTPAHETTNDGGLASLTELMAKKFEEVENNLKKSLLDEVNRNNQKLEQKIEEVVQTNKTYANALTGVENVPGSAPTVANRIPDFRTVMREERNELLTEEAEQKQRAINFIIHGVVEANGDEAVTKQHDTTTVNSLMSELGVDTGYKSLHRLGQRNENNDRQKRPIKVVMNSETDKNLVMASLRKLKDKETYKGISVTDDHTRKERETITEYVNKAREANANEPADSIWEWKARGTPKNGMQLKKFRKRNQVVRE